MRFCSHASDKTDQKIPFFSRPSPKAGRELHIDRMDEGGREAGTLSEKSARASHRAVSLHRGRVLVVYAIEL